MSRLVSAAPRLFRASIRFVDVIKPELTARCMLKYYAGRAGEIDALRKRLICADRTACAM
jgi:hypothetical protein